MAIEVGNTTAGQSSSSSTSYTLAHNLSASAGNNRVLIVQVSFDLAGSPTLSCKYDGVDMIFIAKEFFEGMQVATFYLLDEDLPSTSGSKNIVALATNAGYLKIIALDATGVEQDFEELDNWDWTSDWSSTITLYNFETYEDNALVFFGVASSYSSGTWKNLSSGYTYAGNLVGGSAHTAMAAYKIEGPASTRNLTITTSNDSALSIVGVSFAPHIEDDEPKSHVQCIIIS